MARDGNGHCHPRRAFSFCMTIAPPNPARHRLATDAQRQRRSHSPRCQNGIDSVDLPSDAAREAAPIGRPGLAKAQLTGRRGRGERIEPIDRTTQRDIILSTSRAGR